MKQFIIIAVLLLVLSIVSLFLSPVLGGKLVSQFIPDLPDYPEPQTTLTEDQSGVIYFPSASPYDFDVILNGMESASPIVAKGTLYLPENASKDKPVAAMIIIHGSGGISPGREHEYAKLFTENGMAGFVLDYFAPRGITEDSNYLMSVVSSTEWDAVADAYAALNVLATHPAIAGDKIAVMGFSYGGMATRITLDERVRENLAPNSKGFAAYVDFYGPCFQVLGTTKTNGAPMMTLRGTEDASNDLPVCKIREAELRAIGVEVETHVYPGAGHAWDASRAMVLEADSPYLQGCEIHYDEAGHSMVDGEYMVNVPVETTREQRIAVRFQRGMALQSCVKKGYIAGSHPETKYKSDQHLLAFLKKVFQ